MMSQENLDTVMMEDFGPDIDLLDDLLGMDPTIDWCKLEPSLSMNFDPPSPHSPLGPELPMLPMMGMGIVQPVNSPEEALSPSSHGILQQLSPSPGPPITVQQGSHVVPVTPVINATVEIKNSKTSVLNGTTSTPTQASMSPPITQQPIQLTSTSFAGFGIPFTPTMFGNTVLLPQLQLATVVDSTNRQGKNSNKLPVKRLDKETGRKKASSNRRSSHNAIERRYRSSINDKILELKNLVCAPSDPNEKVHKAAILRSSIDRIRYLQNVNGHLDKENRELKKTMLQCSTCKNDAALQSILATSSPATPPPTENESTDSSNPPSPNEDVKAVTLISKSPLVLFSIVTGLFLINPISNNSPMIAESGEHPHSRVERSVDGTGFSSKVNQIDLDREFYGLWFPRLLTILVNLFIFIIVYYMTGRISYRGWKTKYSTEKLKLLKTKHWTKATTNLDKAEEIGRIISEFDWFPNNSFTRSIGTFTNIVTMPFQLRKRRSNLRYFEINEEISILYLEHARCVDGGIFPYLRAINLSPTNKRTVIQSLIQSKSKLLLKYVLLWMDFLGDPTFGTPEGLLFLKNWISKGITATDFVLCGGPPTGADERTLMMSKFREDTLCAGISQLFQFGSGSDLFRMVLKSCGKNDKLVQFWASVMWVESEWIQGGRRSETVRRLCRLIDELWKNLKEKDESAMLLRAIYKLHMCKRAMMLDHVFSNDMLDTASTCLRDSINTSTDKPRRVVQLIWCLAAEWVLECRLGHWEETKEMNGFSKDLDTLRSLTHYIPALLPSVYLYEACQRLMNYAAPGRTQQLLDASLRQIRNTQRVIICNNSSNISSVAADQGVDAVPTHCNLGRKKNEVNLVRLKRKAFALYLKCKYLPNQVITCPGEKAGMLKEALAALERIGEKKKINECLEMIRSLGQNITLH